ncbi:MAG: hypothetical protein ACLUNO_05930 [Oscillospiraceae bacterium]
MKHLAPDPTCCAFALALMLLLGCAACGKDDCGRYRRDRRQKGHADRRRA